MRGLLGERAVHSAVTGSTARTVVPEQSLSLNLSVTGDYKQCQTTNLILLQCAIMKNNQAAVLYAGIALFLIYNLHSYVPKGEVAAGKWVSLLNGRSF